MISVFQHLVYGTWSRAPDPGRAHFLISQIGCDKRIKTRSNVCAMEEESCMQQARTDASSAGLQPSGHGNDSRNVGAGRAVIHEGSTVHHTADDRASTHVFVSLPSPDNENNIPACQGF